MNRGMRDSAGRPRSGSGGDYGGGRSYGSDGGRRHPRGHGGPGLLDSGMMGGGGYGGGSYEMDSLLHQRSLQQQLSLRESQLALANSLLQQQQHQSYLMDGPGLGMRGPGALGPAPMGLGPGMMMNKRRQDMQGDFGPDFKRPRNDFSPRSRDRYRGQDSDDGNRRSNYRRNQSSSSSRSTSGKSRGPSDKHSAEKSGSDSEGKANDPYHCHVCNVNCRDSEGFQRHMNSMRHNDRMMGLLAVHEEKSVQIASRLKAEKHLRHVEDEDNVKRGFCKICDMSLKVRYAEHQLLNFHKKRVKQVTKGCGWCSVPSFKNFTEVLAHRETEEHQKNQKEHENDEPNRKGRDSERSGSGSSGRKRTPIRVEIPAELARYNSDTTYGQMCVIPVSGWFCKLCNKFYNNESVAKESHCKTEQHYVKYKRFVYAKLKLKAEMEREAEEEKAEEERKKAQEEEDGEGHENGQEEEKDDSVKVKQEEEEEMEEGGEEEEGEEEEEDAMLAAEGSGGEYMDEEDMESGLLEQDTRETSAYMTAEDTTGVGEEEGEEETSAFSIMAGESGSEFFTSQHTDELAGLEDSHEDNLEGEGEGEEDGQEWEGEEEEDEEEVKPRATRATVNTRSASPAAATPGKAGTGKARRGRKMAK